jgi:hypothetical protein
MVFFSIFYSIPPHPASAVSSGRGSLDRLSRNGPLLNPQVGEVLDLVEQLVEDGALDELAKVLPLDFAFVDAQLAAEGGLKRLEPE